MLQWRVFLKGSLSFVSYYLILTCGVEFAEIYSINMKYGQTSCSILPWFYTVAPFVAAANACFDYCFINLISLFNWDVCSKQYLQMNSTIENAHHRFTENMPASWNVLFCSTNKGKLKDFPFINMDDEVKTNIFTVETLESSKILLKNSFWWIVFCLTKWRIS